MIMPLPASTRPRLLCVDDEPQVLAGLANTLRSRFDLTTAGSGAEALELLAQREPFSIVMSDFRMPAMNGAELLAAVRRAAPDTVRILLTGYASLDHALAAVNQGFIFRFLTKPCPASDLLVALDDAVEQSRQVAELRAQALQKVERLSAHLIEVERLAALGTMAGAVGHELNNVLMASEGATWLIEEEVAANRVPSEQDVKTLRHAQERLAAHARNLLDLGRPPRAPEGEADLGETLARVLGMLHAAGVLRHAAVRSHLRPAMPPIAVSRAATEQVLMNLIKNAAEALAESPVENPAVEIEIALDSGGQATCAVSDNGKGIPSSELGALFEPYYTTKPAGRGTGLGLYVVRDIVQRAGGDVTVESSEGIGTTFRVALPLARVQSEVAA